MEEERKEKVLIDEEKEQDALEGGEEYKKTKKGILTDGKEKKIQNRRKKSVNKMEEGKEDMDKEKEEEEKAEKGDVLMNGKGRRRGCGTEGIRKEGRLEGYIDGWEGKRKRM